MNTTVAAPPLNIERTIDATLAETWTAWTEAELVARWFAPGNMRAEVLEYDVRSGGHYRIRMRDEEGGTHTVGGEFVEVTPQRRLVISWAWEGDATTQSKVTVDFDAGNVGTRLRILHEDLPSEESAAKHKQGWIGCLDNLCNRINAF